MPQITVVLPAFNAENYIAESMDSILAQSFKDFELIVVDDASADSTPNIIADYARRDGRVRILTNAVNSKIAASLNRGLAEARAPLVARMDADDWAHPERLAKQYAYMCAHPDVAVCGTGMEEYETGRRHAWAGEGEAVRARLLFDCCLYHPTVMARREALLAAGGYALDMPCAEDYDLWARMAVLGYTMACLPDVLLRYRVHPGVPRAQYKWLMGDSTRRIHTRFLARLGIRPTARQLDRHAFCPSQCPETPAKLREARAWLRTLADANTLHRVYDPAAFREVLAYMEQHFVEASLRRDPRQYLRRWLRNMVKDILFALPWGHVWEAKIVGAARRLGFVSTGRKA